MKIATVRELKKELAERPNDKLVEICLRLAKHKKETKELLHYLIFESHDESSYISAIKEEVEEGFDNMNMANLYWAKKSIRKILRSLNKYIRFSGIKETELELRLFFCRQIVDSGLDIPRSAVLLNLYYRQMNTCQKLFDALHPDLQFDYETELNDLQGTFD